MFKFTLEGLNKIQYYLYKVIIETHVLALLTKEKEKKITRKLGHEPGFINRILLDKSDVVFISENVIINLKFYNFPRFLNRQLST